MATNEGTNANVSSRNGNSAVRRVLQGEEGEITLNSSTSSPVASSSPPRRAPGTPTQRVSGIPTQRVPSSPRNIRVKSLVSHWGNNTNDENVVEISPSKKRKSTTPTKTPSKRRNREETEPQVPEDDLDADKNKLEEPVDPFSIHRLNMDKLRSLSCHQLCEEKMVEQLINKINSDYEKDSTLTFQKRVPTNPPENNEGENNFDFQVITSVQKITQRDKFLQQLKIYETVQRFNKLVFYIRQNEIFAITSGQSWQKIQEYCCHYFPYIISGRIASREGSYQESLKPLTGNVIMRKTTTKHATLFDQLSNIRYSSTKEIRPNASIFWLKEFKPENTSSTQEEEADDDEEENPSPPSPPPSTSSSSQKKFKLTLGMAYLRIQKQMKLSNVPELLDHFSKICRNEKTFSFPRKDEEIQCDDFQKIVPAPTYIFEECEEQILSIFYSFIHNERQDILKEFELCDKYVEDFYMSSNFTLKYNGTELEKFAKIPLVIDVFRALKRKCEQLTKAKDFSEFVTRFKNVKLDFEVSGGNFVGRKLTSLIGCEIIKDGSVYMKSIGTWFELREGFHYKFQQMFHELLNKEGLLLSEGDPGYLTNRWDQDTMPFLKDYVNSYENVVNFSIPSQSQLSSSSSSNENERRKNQFIFDLMQVNREENGDHSIFIYHIFPSFDTKIRGASTRLEMFLETLKQVEKRGPSDNDEDNGHNYDSLTLSQSLSDVYSSQSSQPSFVQLFPSFEMFRQTFLEKGKVTFVAAFRTSQENVVAETHSFTPPIEYIAAALDSCSRRKRCLHLEKNLQFCFNIENVQILIVNRLSQRSGDAICSELNISPEEVASGILDKLLKQRWCKNKEGHVESGDKPVSDKLLTLRNSSRFRLFEDEEVNKEIFELLRPHFITQFPGIFHKLECVIMHDSTMAHSLPRLNFKIMGIKDADE